MDSKPDQQTPPVFGVVPYALRPWAIRGVSAILPTSHIRFHPDLAPTAVEAIERAFHQDVQGSNDNTGVAKAFSSLALDAREVIRCGSFEPGEYQRHEIARSEDWVILALFWESCATDIHDHDESECGFQVLHGRLEETRYAVTSGERVREIARRMLEEGKPVSSNRRAIHRLAALPGERAVSLHAYCPVLECDSMGIYRVDPNA